MKPVGFGSELLPYRRPDWRLVMTVFRAGAISGWLVSLEVGAAGPCDEPVSRQHAHGGFVKLIIIWVGKSLPPADRHPVCVSGSPKVAGIKTAYCGMKKALSHYHGQTLVCGLKHQLLSGPLGASYWFWYQYPPSDWLPAATCPPHAHWLSARPGLVAVVLYYNITVLQSLD